MKKMDKTKFSMGSIFLFFGLIFLVICIFSTKYSIDLKHNSIEAKAYITNASISKDSDGDVHSTFFVSYTYNDKDYTDIQLSSSSSLWRVGDEITILVDNRNPNNIEAKSFLFFLPILLFIFTIAFGGFGSSILLSELKRIHTMNYLIKNGEKIYIEILRIEEDFSISLNNRHPFRYVCKMEDPKTGFYKEVRSNSFMDISFGVEGRKVATYIDKTNPRKFYIDIFDII